MQASNWTSESRQAVALLRIVMVSVLKGHLENSRVLASPRYRAMVLDLVWARMREQKKATAAAKLKAEKAVR